MRFPTRIPTTEQLRQHERQWIQSCHPNWGMVLMEQAARSAAEVITAIWEANPGPIAIFCGSGNNGGDGLVVARYLSIAGMPIAVYLVEGSNKNPQSESQINRAIFEKLGLKINIVDASLTQVVGHHLSGVALIVDALLGTGLDRPVEGVYRDLIDKINKSGKPVVAIDLPSGINSDSGQIMESAVRASATVTFGFLKAGLLCHPGADYAGRLTLSDIGLPPLGNTNDNQPHLSLTTCRKVLSKLPTRPADANKGNFGSLHVIAGSLGMSGASMMASRSALRVGTGLVVLSTPQSLITSLPPQEVIYHPLPETKDKTIHPSAIELVKDAVEKCSAMILGPGLSLNEETVKFVHDLLAKRILTKPCLIDADALNAIAIKPDVFPTHYGHFILTPHPKELSRLIGLTTAEIQANRLEAAHKAATTFGCTVVLKGSRTIIASPNGRAYINPTGNSGMATAGAGDVLSGIIGGLLAQGLDPFDAAMAGVYLHGAAGDIAAFQIGGAGIVAGDIEDFIPIALSKMRSGDYRGSELEIQLMSRPPRQ